ncbi:MAG: bifunctional riboflavin kinase/FAD synthetase [Balneolaceae bacterium]|nr:bifunctional riboflavin kinase/FAD synthetase [Balneolaceae bacterium]
MTELVYLDDVERDPDTVLTVGTFDGVHAGHRVLIDTVVEKTKKHGARSVIVTFDPHPREIINPGDAGIKLLTSLTDRREILEELGVDCMVVIPFDRDFSLLSSEEFIEDVIHRKIGVSEFVIGYDHHFGRDREGTIETVEKLGKKLDFETYVISKQEVGERTVSSTAIRRALSEVGNVRQAAKFLQRPYRLNGMVVHGDKRGKEIGFPTANLLPEDQRKIVPHDGVYAVRVRVEGDWYGGMMNIGVRPTFEGQQRVLEVHLFDFEEEIYGKSIQVRFIERIRDEMKFDGVEELVARLESDREDALAILHEAKQD